MAESIFMEIIHWSGALAAYSTLLLMLIGIWQGTQRKAGRTSGTTAGWLHSGWFFVITTLIFLGVSLGGWVPLPVCFPLLVEKILFICGCFLFFPGIGLVLWARLTLGKNYFVSTSQGVQLFSDHKLIINGPFSHIRHPMYVGLILASLGSLLIYATWTCLCFSLFSPFVLLRARREEIALSEEFGQTWTSYCQQVPAFLPRFRRKK